jgi:murein L,D-transpeptidase YafK
MLYFSAKHPHAMNTNQSLHQDSQSTRSRGIPVLVALTLAGLLGLTGCASSPSVTQKTATGSVNKVVVKKSERQIELQNSRGEVIRKYRVALGGSPNGHKYREGDQRTPVGDYVLNWRKPNSQFYKAIHISYPNERDKIASRQLGYTPGGMIMLHGLPNYIQSESMRRLYVNRDWTHGCIAVQNHEMDEIWNLVPDGTPIRIMP